MRNYEDASLITGYCHLSSSVGKIAIAWNQNGVVALELPHENTKRTCSRLKQKLPLNARRQSPPKWMRRVIRQIQLYLSGKRIDLGTIPVAQVSSSHFYSKVYEILRKTRSGETLTYRQIASIAGSPGASRAVGQAMARNPLPLIIPCHRVVPQSGGVGNYSAPGGSKLKAQLLRMERDSAIGL